MTADSTSSSVLAFSCVDRPGIIATISSTLFKYGWTILESQQFNDRESGTFFARFEFAETAVADDRDAVESELRTVLDTLGADYRLVASQTRKRVLIMASKHDHCLADLLYRARTGDLAMDIVGVVSNHPKQVYGSLNFGSVPFYYLPVDSVNKRVQERQVEGLIAELDVDLVVLARYMQILTDDFSAALSGRCINIHHSFLPGFKGAKPYHQAYVRGVKIIGATAHYVTGDLDEGPIIAQDVEPVSHRDLPDDLVRRGRDIERRVLARAVRFDLEDRVLLNGRTTVVFQD